MDNGLRDQQIDVCNNSFMTVFNSEYTASKYPDISSERIIIPLGIDFNLFRPIDVSNDMNILPDSLLFVGAVGEVKGFDIMMSIVNNSSYNFCFVMKDNFSINHPRIKVFNRVPHNVLIKIYNSCKILICTSRIETQHLAGIEAAACNIPLVVSNVGCYYNREDGEWGMLAKKETDFLPCINYILKNYEKFYPRRYFLSHNFDKNKCMESWKKVIRSI
jgi:glycosyltransferase involved in cell wall biosynthesis